MTKNRFYKFSLIALFVLNVVLICFLIFNKPHHRHKGKHQHGKHMSHSPKHEGPKEEIIRILDLDAKQIEQYEALIEVHQEEISEVEAKIKSAKESLYLTLDSNDSLVESNALNEISQLHDKREIIHLEHFKNIKEICNESQQENYSKLSEKLAEFFNNERKPKRP